MMLSVVEDVASEMCDHEEMMRKEQCGGLPPGFRFHPTDEELISFYLASKVFHGSFSTALGIAEVDLNRCEPWDLPEVAKMGEREWYLFSLRDRKYPTGVRTNRATGAGYWKATGKDRQVYRSTININNGGGGGRAHSDQVLGLKKTLVFYKGRAPRGDKTKWVMHEYRLPPNSLLLSNLQEEWVICRIFHKAAHVDNHKKQHPVLLREQDRHSRLMMQTPPTATPCVSLLDNPFQQNNLFINNQLVSIGFQDDLTALTSKLLEFDGNTCTMSNIDQGSICKTEPNFSHHNNVHRSCLELEYNITTSCSTHNPYYQTQMGPALGLKAPDQQMSTSSSPLSFNRSAVCPMMMLDF